MWHELRLPYICERIIGFSLPEDGQVAIVSYEGVHLLTLNPSGSSSIQIDSKFPEGGELYDQARQVLAYRGKEYSILGIHGGVGIQQGPAGERLDLNLEGEVLKIFDSQGKTVFETPFEDLSGDWGYATFSAKGDYVLLGFPYELRLFRRS